MVRARVGSVWVSVLACLLLAMGCASSAPDPDRIEWDQARVTELAQEFSGAISNLRETALREPSLRSMRGGADQHAARLYLDALRDLEVSGRQLARRLNEGQGFEGTLPVARKIGTLLRDAQNASRRLMTSDDQWAAIDPLIAIINQISPFYSSRSPLMPETMSR